MASYDGTQKATGHGQKIKYWECNTPLIQKVKAEALARASQEAIDYCDLDNYAGPLIECDAAEETENMTEDEAERWWLARREHTLGGSDVGAIFGVDTYKTNIDLFYHKTGQFPASAVKEDDATSALNKEWGHLAEAYASRWVLIHEQKDEFDPNAQVLIDTNIYAHPKYPYMTTNIDGILLKGDGTIVLLEYKTAGIFGDAPKEWESGNIPAKYLLQVRYYMAILGIWVAKVVCVFTRDKVNSQTVYRDLDEKMHILETVRTFWEDHVLAGDMPAPIGDPQKLLEDLNICIPEVKTSSAGYGSRLRLDESFEASCKEYIRLDTQKSIIKAQLETVEKAQQDIRVKLVAALGGVVEGVVRSLDGKSEWYISNKGKKSPAKVDKKKLKALFPDAYKNCVKESANNATRIFSVSFRLRS